MQEEILPSMETQDRMWEEIERKAAEGEEKKGIKPWLRMAASVAAAVLVFVILMPQAKKLEHLTGLLEESFHSDTYVKEDIVKSVYEDADKYGEVKNLMPQGGESEQLTGFLEKCFHRDTYVKEDIVGNVYEDTDEYGHVKMSITEMLSDGACIYCNICYEALDAEGEQWLGEQEFDGIVFTKPWTINSDMDAGGHWEQEELATEKTRYFACYCVDDTGNYGFKNKAVEIFYPMYDGQGRGRIEMETVARVAPVSYRLVGDASPSKYYEPKYLIVSKLSFAIWGEDHGIVAPWADENRIEYYYSKGFWEEKGDMYHKGDVYVDGIPLSFTMKDGSKFDVGKVYTTFTSEYKGFPGAELRICFGRFIIDDDYWYGKIKPMKDPGELAGVEIDGVYYDLVEEEIPQK